MPITANYSAALTIEQFLFHEIRVAAPFYLEGLKLEDAVKKFTQENLFQYPTLSQVRRITRTVYKRLDKLNEQHLCEYLLTLPVTEAKQINLYSIMLYNHLVWDFMLEVAGEKYKTRDYSFSKQDINVFLMNLGQQYPPSQNWTDQTCIKLKSVLVKFLVEIEVLKSPKSTEISPIVICSELRNAIIENNYFEILCAFNCFR